MPDLPVIQGPLPKGKTTVRLWARRINRSAEYVNRFWRAADDWPRPVAQRPRQVGGRRAGGRCELVYDEAELDKFRNRHPEYWPERRVVPIKTALPRDTLVLLAHAADIIGVDRGTLNQRQYRDDPKFPRPVDVPVWRFGKLSAAWPWALDTNLDPSTLVTRQQFAAIAGVSDADVACHRAVYGGPPPVTNDVFRLGEILDYWSARPGKRGTAKSHQNGSGLRPAPDSPPGRYGTDAPAPIAAYGADEKGTAKSHQNGSGLRPAPDSPPGTVWHGRARTHSRFDAANLRRSADAAAATAARVQRALEILDGAAPRQLIAAGELRIRHRQASLEELGQLAEPTLTKDAISGRIRRLLALADRRAAELGIPNTTATQS